MVAPEKFVPWYGSHLEILTNCKTGKHMPAFWYMRYAQFRYLAG